MNVAPWSEIYKLSKFEPDLETLHVGYTIETSEIFFSISNFTIDLTKSPRSPRIFSAAVTHTTFHADNMGESPRCQTSQTRTKVPRLPPPTTTYLV
jgi:hypothetical protein